MIEDAKSGKLPSLYRDRRQILAAKVERKSWANTWFLKGQVAGTISCQATPNGELAREIQKAVNHERRPGNKLQVLEDGGQSVVSSMRTTDPFRQAGCIFGNSTL